MRFALTLILVAGCIPEEDARPSLVADVTVLAVIGEPAEAPPEVDVAFALLVASPEGTVADPDARWSFCGEPRAPVESGPVATGCVESPGPILAEGATALAAIPEDACALHGPDTPPGEFRPRDADATGGYYQPVRVDLEDALTFGAERITCGLANAPVDLALEFRDQYQANRNPVVELGAVEPPRAGDAVELVAGWPAEDRETYVYYDPGARRLVDRRESVSLSWFSTAGAFESDRTGRAEDDAATTSSNTWTAPDEAGEVHLWVVLRDSRGGVAWTTTSIEVLP